MICKAVNLRIIKKFTSQRMNFETSSKIRHDWTKSETLSLLKQPFNDLLFMAQQTHRYNFDPNKVQLSTLMNIKTGGCPEDCAYCPQSALYKTGVDAEKLATVEEVISQAQSAKNKGATRFCMGAAWREPKQRDLEKVIAMVKAVKNMELETCLTLGMLSLQQAETLKSAGLDYYNHNLDSSPEYYSKIISTRAYDERLATLEHVRDVGIRVCCGGIIGMGENQNDRAGLLLTLANMSAHPESVPINMLVKVEGTPLYDAEAVDPIEFIRIIAAARVMMPESYIRLSAGRNDMSDETQALCYLAGANSIFYGEKLLTTDNPQLTQDRLLLERLGMQPTKN